MNQQQLDRLHSVEVNVLDDFVRICEKHNLGYSLIGGSVIGAVRHSGFIPWDDDIDVVMPRQDFDEFVKIAPSECGDDYYLDYFTTNHTYGLNFAKYCKSNTAFEEVRGLTQGIYIDIFVLDNAISPEDTETSWRLNAFRVLDGLIYMRRYGIKGRPFHTKVAHYITSVIPLSCLVRWQRSVMTWVPDESSEYFINWGSRYSLVKETIRKEKYLPFSKLEFEGKMYNVPGDYDHYLTRVYGDYMQLPPVEKRVTHNPQRLSFDLSGPDEEL